MSSKTTVFLALLLTMIFGGGAYKLLKPHSQKPFVVASDNTKNNTDPVTNSKSDSIRIIATGDFIPHDSINQEAKKSNGNYDYSGMMSNMAPIFAKADVRFCNQATPVGGTKYGISGFPIFNAPFEFTRDMAGLGCNLINIGTNHSNDKGQSVIDAQRSEWDKQPNILAVAGANRNTAEQQKINYFTVKGVKFSFLSYVTYSNTKNMTSYGVNMFNQITAKSQLAEARKNSDIILVSMRWGTEYSSGINAEQASDSQFLADNGADIILGHGPHSLEPYKKLLGQNSKSTHVFYSLGNFLNAQLEVDSLFSGLAVFDVDVASKQVANVSYLPIYMHYEWTSSEAAAQNLLARRNFQLFTLDQASKPLAASNLKTTVDIQKTRIEKLLNQYDSIHIVTASQLN